MSCGCNSNPCSCQPRPSACCTPTVALLFSVWAAALVGLYRQFKNLLRRKLGMPFPVPKEASMWHTGSSASVTDRHFFSVKNHADRSGFVPMLLRGWNPAAVFLAVISVHVIPLNGVFGWTDPHIANEIIEVVPLRADGDASTPVVFESLCVGVIAAGIHGHPSCVGSLEKGISRFSVPKLPTSDCGASTAIALPFFQSGKSDRTGGTADTFCNHIPVHFGKRDANNFLLPEGLSNYVFEACSTSHSRSELQTIG